ncbi:bacterial regulatory, arsR family protein [Clostridium sporogenes]|uniref:ArsR/SmtB family transcription factor n=1 Tax=Clostridium TaxID=1485 RepID=UPI00090AB58B|nr:MULTISPECIES: metalloregulator ArsR/SmtB family transcription factor [Clostridium]APF25390.1 bacterial regulatory, arsR family protein [Clostridium sporogenes]MDI6918661.1 metalloregulator ArsR/SmtB family transcription factor [Clostridium botulinum]WMU98171.1 metalloregulator ArsR/SmtB family transcription factor [Clostridium botulinum]
MDKERQIDTCTCNVIHHDVVDKVKDNMIEEDKVQDLGDFFKVLSEPTRIKILYALASSEMCVCDISNLLNMTQSAVSHQLKVLRIARLIKFRKEGKVVYYSLDDSHVENVFKQGLEHIMHR